ncbi:hypothetical protein [Psychroserpens damuponensis]|uniref:hypothetical protein n=1 Tax=Psychroserpens damuponensis TaxID=943936 RepID=UPI0005917F1E|nr:hypothetical protein [Psychroserpens damuponensis]
MKIPSLIILFFTINFVSAQDFEGVIRYGVTIEPIEDLVESDQRMEDIKKIKRKKESDSALVAYVKNDKILKFLYKPLSINIYERNTETIYTIEKNDDHIGKRKLTNRARPDRKKPVITAGDTIANINNFSCKTIVFDYGYYTITAYYNEDPKYKGMGQVIFFDSLTDYDIKNSLLKDALIVRYVQKYGDVNTFVDLLDLKEVEVDTSIFTIPKYKKSREYDYDDDDIYQFYKIADKTYKYPDFSKL